MSDPVRRNKLKDWLESKIRQECWLSVSGSIGLILLGSFVTFLTFWIIYGIAGFVGLSLFSVSHNGLLVFSGIIVAVLFIANAISDREHLERLEFEKGPGVTATIWIGRLTGHGMTAAFVGPKNFSSFVKILSTIILSGPRLFALAWRLAYKAARLRRMDIATCARIISMLTKKESKIPITKIVAKFSNIDPQIVFPQLRDINGIVFLLKEPIGLTITPGLVDEIREWKAQQAGRVPA